MAPSINCALDYLSILYVGAPGGPLELLVGINFSGASARH